MNDLKLRNFTIGNSQPLTLMGGMNVLESRDLVLQVAEKFKLYQISLRLIIFLKVHLIRLIEVLCPLSEVQAWMRVLNYFKKFQQNIMFL